MKALRVAEARARFGEVLDRAEQGDDVFIERNGVRFLVKVEKTAAPVAHAPLFTKVHRDVVGGQWSWSLSERGLRFRARKAAR